MAALLAKALGNSRRYSLRASAAHPDAWAGASIV